MFNSNFGNNIRGVKEAAAFYYNKNLVELTEREILELNFLFEENLKVY